ncbi:MAG: HutD family protein [Paracoccus sp. (in: a-proteobacteria)]|uniref:HutD/Ves family protein n=1 Tax=Paracoccus sp. TaxID=267 RepID=UPI0039E60EF7
MPHHLLPAHAHRRMPWKNGKGETVQIAAWPEGAGLDGFDWRISMAGVTEDGDFSIFPGIDRSLAVLTGQGIELRVQGMGLHRLTSDGPALAFPADRPCLARLADGPITDLNLMTRRGRFRHRLVRAGEGLGFVPDWLLLLATRPARLHVAGAVLDLGPLDAVICDGPEAALDPGVVPGAWLAGIAAA